MLGLHSRPSGVKRYSCERLTSLSEPLSVTLIDACAPHLALFFGAPVRRKHLEEAQPGSSAL